MPLAHASIGAAPLPSGSQPGPYGCTQDRHGARPGKSRHATPPTPRGGAGPAGGAAGFVPAPPHYNAGDAAQSAAGLRAACRFAGSVMSQRHAPGAHLRAQASQGLAALGCRNRQRRHATRPNQKSEAPAMAHVDQYSAGDGVRRRDLRPTRQLRRPFRSARSVEEGRGRLRRCRRRRVHTMRCIGRIGRARGPGSIIPPQRAVI